MKILTIDLGETTGYAFLDGNQLLKYGTFRDKKLPDLPATPDYVVIERPAYIANKEQAHYEEVTALIKRLFGTKRVKVVRPADWMPRFNHYPLPGRGVLRTQHEKDAFRMAHWALEKFGGQR